MQLYSYKAVKANGEVVEGDMEVTDQTELVSRLQADGLIPIKMAAAGKGGLLNMTIGGKKAAVSQQQILHLTRELATLLEAGMTLDRALYILIGLGDDPALVSMLEAIRDRVHSGMPLSEALEAQGKVFSPLYISMVKAGEAGGVLQEVLHRLVDYLERSQELRESVRSALTYPMILFVVAGLSVIGLLVFVVPQFSQMFEDMGQVLPLPTQIVIGIGDAFRNYWWAMALLVFVGIAWFRQELSKPASRARWDRRLLNNRLVGDLVAKVETARFSRTLSILLANGLPLLTALKLVKEVIGNTVIAESIAEASDKLTHGKGLSGPLIEQQVLPPLALQMIKVGEETGDLGPMLDKVADVFDREVRLAVKQMLTLLEPAVIVGLGVIVAGIIVSILLAVLGANELAI